MLSVDMKMVAIAAAIMAVGCVPVRTVTQSVRDSVVVRETVRDTVIEIGPDSSLLRALVECDSLGRARLSVLLDYEAGGRMGPPVVTMVDNVLTAKAVVDSFGIYAELKDRYEERWSSERVVETVEVNRLTAWQKVRMRMGEALIVIAALSLVYGIGRLV